MKSKIAVFVLLTFTTLAMVLTQNCGRIDTNEFKRMSATGPIDSVSVGDHPVLIRGGSCTRGGDGCPVDNDGFLVLLNCVNNEDQFPSNLRIGEHVELRIITLAVSLSSGESFAFRDCEEVSDAQRDTYGFVCDNNSRVIIKEDAIAYFYINDSQVGPIFYCENPSH
jgi:hypothetical protein